jgi:hypothetical protein
MEEKERSRCNFCIDQAIGQNLLRKAETFRNINKKRKKRNSKFTTPSVLIAKCTNNEINIKSHIAIANTAFHLFKDIFSGV